MVNPVTVQLLNEAEKYRRSEQVEVCQLLNKAQEWRSSRSSLWERVMNALSNRFGVKVDEQLASPDTQLLGRTSE